MNDGRWATWLGVGVLALCVGAIGLAAANSDGPARSTADDDDDGEDDDESDDLPVADEPEHIQDVFR